MFIIAILLILAGVAILLYPIVGNHIAEWHRRRSAAEFYQAMRNIEPELIQQKRELFGRYNEFIFNRQEGLSFDFMTYDEIAGHETQVMGTLDVPALGITSLPFYYGTSYRVLDMGLGHWERSTIPIGGINTRGVITGHAGVTNQLLFTEINRLHPGDIFFVNILGDRLAYEIVDIEEILPFEVERVRIRPGHDMVTLLTCSPPGINTYRLLVNGYRIDYEEAITRAVVTRNFWSYQRVVLGSLSLILLLFIVCYVRYRQLQRWMKNSQDPIQTIKAIRKTERLLRAIKIMFVLLFLSTLVVFGFAVHGYLRMQRAPDYGVMQIGPEGQFRQYNINKIMNADYDERQIASVNISSYAEALARASETVNNWGIGRMILPESQIDLPILAGIANINLITGGSTFRMGQQMGRCNYVLLTHSVYGARDVLFQPLSETRRGEQVFLTDFEQVYVYEVRSNQVVHDSEVHWLAQLELDEQGNTSTPLLTLMRCEGNIGTRYRRVVQAELINIQPLNTETLEKFRLSESALEGDRRGTEAGTDDQTGRVQDETPYLPLLILRDPVSQLDRISIGISAMILSDPIQVALPIVLLLLFPIIFLNILPATKKTQPKS